MNDNHKFIETEFNVPEPGENVVDQLLHIAHARLGRRLDRIRRPVVRAGVVDSALGRLFVAESGRGLLTVRFLQSHEEAPALASLRRRFEVVEDDAITARIGDEIDRLMHGDALAITQRSIDLSLVESEFQRRALTRLRQVPVGSVISYQALAAAVGAPSAQRAVGNTVASNPLAIYVPCHRVIRSDGSIGNYGGGVERKLKLLRAEGFKVDRDRRVPSKAVYGHWTSRIFCLPTCSAVRRAERRKWIIFADAEKARSAGLRACKLCQPAQLTAMR